MGEKGWERNATFPVVVGLVTYDGKMRVTRQPIEWMLSQDSVGQIVDVCDRDRCWYGSKKLSANFATTQTAAPPCFMVFAFL